MNELMGLTYHRTAKRGIQVLPRPNEGKIILGRPIVFLKKNLISDMFGFKWCPLDESGNLSKRNFYIKEERSEENEQEGKTFVLRGHGIMTLYVFDIVIETPPILTCGDENFRFYIIDGFGVRCDWDYSWAKKIVRNIQTPDDLKLALSGI